MAVGVGVARRVVMQRFLLALTAVGIGLFALVKPVHIDDTVVLHVAQNILCDPLRPFAGDFFWLEAPQPLAKVTTNPPLVSYWLAPWIVLTGYREWVLHLSCMPFILLLMWGMHRLATRWLGAEWAWWAVGWLMLSPAVIPGMNLMRDVPALSLFVGGLACWVEGLERHQVRWLLIGALLGGLAGLAKYTALIWIPLVALYTLWRRAYGALGCLLIALLPIAGWSALNLWADGEVHLLYLWQERRGSAPWEAKLLPGVVGLGASTLLLLGSRQWFVDTLRQGRGWQLAILVLAAAGALYWHITLFAGRPVYGQTLFWLLMGVGVLGLAMLGSLPEGMVSVSPFLRLWLVVALMASVWGVPFQAMRHLLYALPPLILLLTPWVGRKPWLLLTQGVLAWMVIAADYDYAVRYKRSAAAYAEMFQGARVWYVGSWGWMFYAEQHGFRKLLPDGSGLQRGDIVIIPERVYKGKMPPHLHKHLILLEETPCLPTVPMRTMDFRGAAYYALIRTNAPFHFTLRMGEPLETFRAYRWMPPP
jgi:hypothetical protein